MIPYLGIETLSLGPLTIQVWGLCVAIGIVLGIAVAKRQARFFGVEPALIDRYAFPILLGAFIGARLMHVLFYDPSFYFAHIEQVFFIWEGGFSSTGGFIGAFVMYYFLRKKDKGDLLSPMNALIFGLPFGMTCGRIGCFLIHDHPGTLTNSVLGVKYPNGEVRHDLGLYLALNAFILTAIFLWMRFKGIAKKAVYVQVFLIYYGCTRFLLDFLRLGDQLYAGLTPAQYVSLIMIGGGLFWPYKSRQTLEYEKQS